MAQVLLSEGAAAATPAAGKVAVYVKADGLLYSKDDAGAESGPFVSGASGANPTGTIAGAAVNGAAATFLRSDGAPAISNQIIIPRIAAGGTVDAITATVVPALTLADQVMVAIVSAGASTSTTPTFAPNGLTAHTITARGAQALVVGDTGPAGYVMLLQYRGSDTSWELLNPAKLGPLTLAQLNTAVSDADVAILGANTFTGVQSMTSPAITTSITTPSTTFTAFAGATTLLTIGGTGATSVFAIPGTLDASGTTGALTNAGGFYNAKAANIVGILTLSNAIVGPATATVFNTVSTTVNAFGAASTALNIGHASGTNTVSGATTFSQSVGSLSSVTSGEATTSLGSFSQTATANSQITGATFRNVNAGNAATLALFFGNNATGAASAIYVYGSNHATYPSQVWFGSNTTGSTSLIANNTPGLTLANGGAVSIPGTLAVTSTISTGATSSTGTAVIIDGSNILRPLTSSERFKNIVQRDWTAARQQQDFLAISPIVFDYKDEMQVEVDEEFTNESGEKASRKVRRGENRIGEKGVLGFSAEDAHAKGLTYLLNYDKEGKPYSFRDPAIMAYQHSALQDHERRLQSLEAKIH